MCSTFNIKKSYSSFVRGVKKNKIKEVHENITLSVLQLHTISKFILKVMASSKTEVNVGTSKIWDE